MVGWKTCFYFDEMVELNYTYCHCVESLALQDVICILKVYFYLVTNIKKIKFKSRT